MRALLLLAFAATTAFGQQTVQGTCSITLPASASLPAHVVTYHDGQFWDGTVAITDPSFNSISLTGGPTYADGKYLTQITSSKLSYSPYSPTTSATSAIQFATVSIPASKVTISPGGVFDFPYKPPTGRVIGVEPNTNPGNWMVDHYAGAIRLRNLNNSLVPSLSPAITVTVSYE